MGAGSAFLDTYIYCSTVREQKKKVSCFRIARNGFSLIFRGWLLISLSDVSVFALIIMICKGCICKRKDNEQDT